MRIGNYVVRPDAECWVVSRIAVKGEDAKNPGEEYETDPRYPATFDQALARVLEFIVRDGYQPDETLTDAVARVERAYRQVRAAVEVTT